MSNISAKKVIYRREMRECVITRWIIPKGEYNLYLCDLNNEMFGIVLTLVYGPFEDFKRFIKDEHEYEAKANNPLGVFLWVLDKEKHTRMYLLITENEWRSRDYGTICHELHHFTHHALTKKVGMAEGEGGEEIYAYFQGHFMELACRAFLELRKALDKKKKR